MRHAQFDELRRLLVVQDVTLIVIAVALVIGVIMLIVAAGDRSGRDIRDTQARNPQTRRRTM